jgi:hypothetical protein
MPCLRQHRHVCLKRPLMRQQQQQIPHPPGRGRRCGHTRGQPWDLGQRAGSQHFQPSPSLLASSNRLKTFHLQFLLQQGKVCALLEAGQGVMWACQTAAGVLFYMCCYSASGPGLAGVAQDNGVLLLHHTTSCYCSTGGYSAWQASGAGLAARLQFARPLVPPWSPPPPPPAQLTVLVPPRDLNPPPPPTTPEQDMQTQVSNSWRYDACAVRLLACKCSCHVYELQLCVSNACIAAAIN